MVGYQQRHSLDIHFKRNYCLGSGPCYQGDTCTNHDSYNYTVKKQITIKNNICIEKGGINSSPTNMFLHLLQLAFCKNPLQNKEYNYTNFKTKLGIKEHNRVDLQL